MARLIFDLDDERRAKLETIRASRGLRSLADALRCLIDREGGEPVEMAVPGPKPPVLSHSRSKTVVVAPKRKRVEVADIPARRRLDLPLGNIRGPMQKGEGKKR